MKVRFDAQRNLEGATFVLRTEAACSAGAAPLIASSSCASKVRGVTRAAGQPCGASAWCTRARTRPEVDARRGTYAPQLSGTNVIHITYTPNVYSGAI